MPQGLAALAHLQDLGVCLPKELGSGHRTTNISIRKYLSPSGTVGRDPRGRLD